MSGTVGFAIPASYVSAMTSYTTPSPAELAEMDPIPLSIEIAKSQIPHIAALALAYWLAAWIGHRTQLAAAALPPAPSHLSLPNVTDSNRSIRRRLLFRKLFSFALIALVLVLELLYLRHASREDAVRFSGVMFSLVVFQQVLAFVMATPPYAETFLPWELVRAPDTGFVKFRIDPSRSTRRERLLGIIGASWVAASVTYFGFAWGDAPDIVRQAAAVACLAMAGARPLGRIMSIRRTIIGLLVFEALTMAVTVMIITITISIAGLTASSSTSPPPTDSDSLDTTSPSSSLAFASLSQFSTLVPALYASLNAFLIVLCWRFDYFLHLHSSNSTTTTLTVPGIAVRKDDKGNHCASIPHSTPSRFPRTYFILSLVLTLLSHLSAPILLALFATRSPFFTRDDLPDDYQESHQLLSGPVRDLTAGWLGPFIAGPVAGLGVVGLSLIRGEGKKLWRYEERWSRREGEAGFFGGEEGVMKEEGGVRLEEEEEEGLKTPTMPSIVVMDLDKTPTKG